MIRKPFHRRNNFRSLASLLLTERLSEAQLIERSGIPAAPVNWALGYLLEVGWIVDGWDTPPPTGARIFVATKRGRPKLEELAATGETR